jgi:hypothetical protein
MKGIKIDAVNQMIFEVEVDGLKGLQKEVGGYIEMATSFPNGDVLFVDEEGLLKNPEYFFEIKGAYQPFGGNGIVVGTTNSGDSISAKSFIKDINKVTRFLTLSQVREMVMKVSAFDKELSEHEEKRG